MLFARIAKKSKSYAHKSKEICYNARIMAGVRKTGLAEKIAAIPWNFSIPHAFLRAGLSILPLSPLRIKQIIHGASYRTWALLACCKGRGMLLHIKTERNER